MYFYSFKINNFGTISCLSINWGGRGSLMFIHNYKDMRCIFLPKFKCGKVKIHIECKLFYEIKQNELVICHFISLWIAKVSIINWKKGWSSYPSKIKRIITILLLKRKPQKMKKWISLSNKLNKISIFLKQKVVFLILLHILLCLYLFGIFITKAMITNVTLLIN